MQKFINISILRKKLILTLPGFFNPKITLFKIKNYSNFTTKSKSFLDSKLNLRIGNPPFAMRCWRSESIPPRLQSPSRHQHQDRRLHVRQLRRKAQYSGPTQLRGRRGSEADRRWRGFQSLERGFPIMVK